MRRRTLLATTGVVLSAGCSALPGTGDEPATTTGDTADTTAATDAETPPGGPTTGDGPATTTDAATADTTETDARTATERETETETRTPTQAEREAARRIDQARSALADALTAYADTADVADATLLSVNASIDITISDVSRPVGDARSALDQVPERASSEQEATVEALRGIATFLDRGVRCQSKLHDAYGELTFVVDRFYAENLGLVPDRIAGLREETERARGFFETLAAESSAEDAAALDALDESTYAEKVTQFESELDTFPTVADALSSFYRGLDAFLEAADDYLDGSYRNPREQFPEAADGFRTVVQLLTAIDAPESIAGIVLDLVTIAEALAPACDDLAAASEAGYRGNSSEREDRFAAAQAHLESADIAVQRFDTVAELVDE